MPPQSLQLSQSQLDVIIAHARAYPGVEVVGLLGGQGGKVRGVYPLDNNSPSPEVSFLLGDQDFIDAYFDIEKQGWDLLAIYHSHPRGVSARPSPADVAHANYPEALNLIVSVDGRRQPVARVFQIVAGRVREVELNIVPGTT
jgi:proteasome lid subunit RPN8/RPN11